MALGQLLEDLHSPLNSVGKLIKEGDLESKERLHRLSHDVRLFACMMRKQVRDRVWRIIHNIKECLTDGIDQTLRNLVDDISKVLRHWRGIYHPGVAKTMPRLGHETCAMVDEYISLYTETRLSILLQALDRHKVLNKAGPTRRDIKKLILAERSLREERNYQSVIEDDDKNEYFVYRKSKLKKFIMSILWLRAEKEKQVSKLANLGPAIAAGVAMLFTAVATIFHSQWTLSNTSWFVVAVTFTYILKDRIKDKLKKFFANKSTSVLFDNSLIIKDPITEKRVGKCREAMSYLAASNVPKPVMEFRRQDARYILDGESNPEVIIRYEKEIRLYGTQLIDRLHVTDHDVNDIIRFSLARMQQHADDPMATLPYYDEDDDQVIKRRFNKVYHLNLVMVFRSEDDELPAVYRRVRVVFDRKRILRTEQVNPRIIKATPDKVQLSKAS